MKLLNILKSDKPKKVFIMTESQVKRLLNNLTITEATKKKRDE